MKSSRRSGESATSMSSDITITWTKSWPTFAADRPNTRRKSWTDDNNGRSKILGNLIPRQSLVKMPLSAIARLGYDLSRE